MLGRFLQQVTSRPDALAIRWFDGPEERHITWRDYARLALQFAQGLIQRGLRQGDVVALMMRNRWEFHVADVGTQLAGGTPVSLYISSTPDQVRFVCQNAEVKFAVIERPELVARFPATTASSLRGFVLLDGEPPRDDVVPWGHFLVASGIGLDERVARVRPGDIIQLVYTSGTTGIPKGVMTTQGAMTQACHITQQVIQHELLGQPLISYLPMAHNGERGFGHHRHIYFGAVLTPCPDPRELLDFLPRVRPALLFGVPLIWRRLEQVIRDLLGHEPRGGSPGVARALQQVGLDRLKIAISGGAPLSVGTFSFFSSIGVPLSESWGMSETVSAATWSPLAPRHGTVGRPMPGVRVTIANDGEVVLTGTPNMIGYLRNQAETEKILRGKRLYTGDLGALDEDGYLTIIGRKKHLIITEGGKKISPAQVEAGLRAEELIRDAIVIGEGRPFITALLCAGPTALGAARSVVEAADAALAKIDEAVLSVNSKLPMDHRISRYALLSSGAFDSEELLTPSGKIRREAVEQTFSPAIDDMYRPKLPPPDRRATDYVIRASSASSRLAG
jgi:long-chain acyl-CoA synthetase